MANRGSLYRQLGHFGSPFNGGPLPIDSDKAFARPLFSNVHYLFYNQRRRIREFDPGVTRVTADVIWDAEKVTTRSRILENKCSPALLIGRYIRARDSFSQLYLELHP